jgi:fluoroacetyl-CoA thioesterase
MSVKARTVESRLRVSPAPHPQGTEEATNLSPADGPPAVLETSRMVELMELAAARLMKPHLRDGESSVTVSLNLTHLARATVKGFVRAVATHQGIAGRIHRFTVHAFDETGLIGSAEHARAVVAEKRLMAMARRRLGKPSLMVDV